MVAIHFNCKQIAVADGAVYFGGPINAVAFTLKLRGIAKVVAQIDDGVVDKFAISVAQSVNRPRHNNRRNRISIGHASFDDHHAFAFTKRIKVRRLVAAGGGNSCQNAHSQYRYDFAKLAHNCCKYTLVNRIFGNQ